MTVQQFIASQPDPRNEIMTVLRLWILDLGHHVQEKISYKIPYYYFFGPLCYLSPTKEGVNLAFAKGYELSDEQHLLESIGRKRVKSVTFYSVAELEEHEEEVRKILNEAAILNEYQFRRKEQRKTK